MPAAPDPLTSPSPATCVCVCGVCVYVCVCTHTHTPHTPHTHTHHFRDLSDGILGFAEAAAEDGVDAALL